MTIAGAVLLVLGFLASWQARAIAPQIQQAQIERTEHSVFSATYRERLIAMDRSPKVLIVTMWETRIFGAWVAIAGLVLLIAGLLK